MVPLRLAASFIANADLPLAVGPAMRSVDKLLCIPTPYRSSPMVTHVATLICNPAAAVLTPNLVAHLAKTVQPKATAWLNDGIAVDLLFERPSTDQVQQLRALLETLPVDVIVQPLQGRRKRLFLADMDSTMIGQECIDELADHVALKPFVAEITARAMRGEIAFEPALRQRVALLKGLSLEVIDRVLRERITLTAGGQTLVATLRGQGVRTILVSGGFSLFTAVIAQKIGFDDHRANVLTVANGSLVGSVEEPILGREGKLECLRYMTRELGLSPHQTLAVGDGANDLAMLQAAGLGIAFHAQPLVAAQVKTRVDHGDLTALLYAQGYAVHQFSGLGEGLLRPPANRSA
jgi:phosphoserine phosphatase